MALDQHHCPRCTKPLTSGTAGPISGLVCPACGGLWLDHDLAVQFREALVSNSRLDVSESARIIGESSASRAKRAVSTTPDALPCVVCGQSMQREKIAKVGFDLDICHEHGTWYDCGELQRIAHLAGAKAPSQTAPGGLSSHGASLDGNEGKAAVAFVVLGVIFDILSELG
ncbi:MAG: zf-TFIIB domain-containing protein [Deltaproteobacteria bacterium]|nr:zf-TFIIB domain-containing protein [Deltaproteobacteria bacterium]